LAVGTVQLSGLISYGSMKYQVDLTDPDGNKLEATKLMINLEYKTPSAPPTGPKAAPISKLFSHTNLKIFLLFQ
jgi:hypothetical protein